MVSFSGWEMPLEYSGIADEHMAVRSRAGLFDVSHMGEIEIAGKDALAAVQRISSNDASRLQIGQAHYSLMLTPQGTIKDDLLVYRLAAAHFLLIVNAGNIQTDYAWIAEHIKAAGDAVAVDASSRYALLALQGPRSLEILQPLIGVELGDMKYYRFVHGEVAGVRATVSRTGYTGDLGYELWIPSEHAVTIWDALVTAGRAFDIHAAGMLALDVARVEAGLLLIDVDFNSSKKALVDEQRYSPFEMGLGRLVNLDKGRFVGQSALIAEQKRGHAREIIGLEIDWPQVESLYEEVGLPPAVSPIASRVAVPVFKEGTQVGKATTSTWSPTLKKMIALATVKREFTKPGTKLQFEITVEAVRHSVRATVVKMPFFNPKRKTATPI